MATCKPHQHAHLANGIRRIKQAISNCDLAVSEVGTIFPKPQSKCKHEWVMPEDSFELPYCKHCYKGA
jgi:hypothetical protein